MRTIPILVLACLTGGSTLVSSAYAQQSAPPGLQPLDEPISLPAPSTVSSTPTSPRERQEPGATNETRLPGGRVTEIEVRSGGSTYYLHPQTAAGGAQRDSARTTQWNILNFNTPQSGRNASPPAPVPPPPRAD